MPVALGAFAAADLLTLLAWIVCLGMVLVWHHTIGRGLIALANELDKASVDLPWPIGTVHIFGPISSAIRWVEGTTAHWLGEAALATEHATLFLWNHTVSIVEELAHWIEDATYTTYHAFDSVLTVTLPRYFHNITGHVDQRLHSVEADAHKAETAIRKDTAREIARVETRSEEIVHHAEAVISADVLPRIKTVEVDLDRLKERLERIAKSLNHASIVALIGATIWKELFNGVKCSSWGNLIKNRGCGAWSGLENLLGLLVDLFVITEVCDVLPVLDTAISDVASPLVVALTGVGAGLCAEGSSSPATLTGPATILPAVYFTGTLILA